MEAIKILNLVQLVKALHAEPEGSRFKLHYAPEQILAMKQQNYWHWNISQYIMQSSTLKYATELFIVFSEDTQNVKMVVANWFPDELQWFETFPQSCSLYVFDSQSHFNL